MSRLEDDRAKLLDAVKIFRTRANLHASSPVSSLIAWAHESGQSKPYANMVRDAWHDFEMGRRYAELPVHAYKINYPSDEPEPPPPTDAYLAGGDEGEGDALGRVSEPSSPSVETIRHDALANDTGRDPEGTGEEDHCPHAVTESDGDIVACSECGELLGERDEKTGQIVWADGYAHETLEDAAEQTLDEDDSGDLELDEIEPESQDGDEVLF